MNRAEMIREALRADAMSEAWAKKAKRIRQQLTAMAVEEFETEGAAPSWRTEFATVPLALSSDDCKVTNQRAWIEWVERNHPEQIEQVTQVRPAWAKGFLGKLRGEEGAAFTADGEIIPGLLHVPGGQPKGVSIRPKDGVKNEFAAYAEAELAALFGNNDMEEGK